MIDFAYCPACQGYGESCKTCGETGDRIINEAIVHEAFAATEWLDERISQVYSEYKKVMKISDYGVERWSQCGNTVTLVVDTSCRGCYDTDSVDLPLELFCVDENRRREILTDLRSEKEQKERAEVAARQSRVQAQRKKLYEELKSEFSSDMEM